MPKQSQRADVNNFIGGLITEASPLNFPPNASADELNFELSRTGIRRRRLGMDYESGSNLIYANNPIGQAQDAGYNSFKWESVSGNASVSLLVVQVNQILQFFDLNADSITGAGSKGFVFLSQFPLNTRYSFAATEGLLAVVSGADTFAVVNCNTDTFTFGVDYERIQVRDVWGVEEVGNPSYENDPSYRGPFDAYHNYNLRNQSWGIPRKDKGGNLVDPAARYAEDLLVYPSNSEQVWPGLQQQPVAQGQDPFERIFTNLYTEVIGATTNTAKGYFIIDALRRGVSRQEQFIANQVKYPQIVGAVSIPTDFTPGGPSCIADFAGRIFFSGFQGEVVGSDARSPNLDNYVFFSQLVKSKTEFAKCYQDGDPTSREANDIVDTDGGFVRVSGARNIIALVNLQTHLIVIAENGIWSITGGTVDSGFTATNYKASKISTFGGISIGSVVSEGSTAYYWAADGIYGIGKNQYGDMEVKSLTLQTIQSLYQAIPNDSKQSSFGEYDQINKKVRWIYKTGSLFAVDSVTKELIFDSALGTFTQNLIYNAAVNTAEVIGIFRASNFSTGAAFDDVYSNVDQVFSGTDNVIVSSSSLASNIQSMRYVTLVAIAGQTFLTVSYYKETSFVDWLAVDGVGTDAKAFCLTGSVTAGDSSVEKQIPYIVTHMIRTEQGVDSNYQPLHQSSCLMRTQWNFANSIVSNQWSPLRQAYRYNKARLVESLSDSYDTGYQLITTKNKMRGRGRAFAVYFETEPGKDCQIVGWNISLNGNQNA